MEIDDQSTKRNFKGVWIPREIWLSSELSLQEKVLLVEIDSLCSAGPRGCWATNKHFSEFMGLSKPRITALISSLSEKGFVTVSMKKEGNRVVERNIFTTRKCRFGGQFTDYAREKGGQFPDGGWSGSNEENNTDLNNTRSKDLLSSALQKDGVRVTEKKENKKHAYDKQKIINTWNAKAKQHGLPTIRTVTKTVEDGLIRLYKSHLRMCKEMNRTPKDMDTLINGYVQFGYEPTEWAKGANPTGKRFGIATALRQERIDEILEAAVAEA